MSEWREIKLKECIETNKRSIGKDYQYSEILYLDTGSITANRIDGLQEFNISDAPSRAKRLVQENDIIYSSVRPNQLHYGFIKNPKENLVVSTGFVVITCNQEEIQPQFLFYYLSSDTSTEYLHSIAEASTSAYPSLKPSDIEVLDILLPPLPEQKAIAEVLSSLDDKIDLLHRQNKTLEQMAETLFRQWFVEEAKEDWGETISKIPIDIIDGDRGKNYPKSVDFFDEEYCLFLSAKNVTTDGFDFSQKQFITKEKDSQLRKGKLMRGDIILTTRGTVGNFSFYDDTISFDNIRINSGMIILRSKKYDPILFYNIFKSDYFKKNLSEFISGSAQPQIPIRDFREIMIPFPTEVVINKYLKLIKPLYSKLFKCNKQIRTLEKMRDTLLPKLISGEVKVSIDE